MSRLSLLRSRALELGRARVRLHLERPAERAVAAWGQLVRRGLVAWRAIALAQLLEELFAKGAISREKAVSLHLWGY